MNIQSMQDIKKTIVSNFEQIDNQLCSQFSSAFESLLKEDPNARILLIKPKDYPMKMNKLFNFELITSCYTYQKHDVEEILRQVNNERTTNFNKLEDEYHVYYMLYPNDIAYTYFLGINKRTSDEFVFEISQSNYKIKPTEH
jgi:hypothetical protein